MLRWIGLLVCLLSLPAAAEESGYGSLDFAKLTKPQEAFFFRRLGSLAVEEAVLSYCGQPDDFETAAKQGVRACVTQAALEKAEAAFHAQMKTAEADLRQRRASCKAKPEATRGWLGVEIEAADKGAKVKGAIDGSPAASADIKPGDVIEAVNGEAVATPKALSAKIRSFAAGAAIELGLERDGAARKVAIKLGAMAFDPDGRAALDMPALVEASKTDLKKVADEVTDMCSKCKSSIWAVFCR
jgi:hypothetical protein